MKIFISHSLKDEIVIREIKDALLKEGFEPYIATEKKQPGGHLSRKVKRDIDSSDVFLAVLTQNAVSSAWVNQELGYAEGKVHIIPLIQKGIEPPAFLQGREYLELDVSQLDKTINECISYLREYQSDMRGKKMIPQKIDHR